MGFLHSVFYGRPLFYWWSPFSEYRMVPLKIPASCRVGIPVYWCKRKYCTFIGQPTAKPLVPLVHHRHLLLSAAEASSPSLSSPLVHPIRRHRTPLVHSRYPLSHSHQCHSTVTLHHSSAGHHHQIITSCQRPPIPLAHDTPLVCHQTPCCLLSATGRATSCLRFCRLSFTTVALSHLPLPPLVSSFLLSSAAVALSCG
jgi:hypothetical protein